MRLEPGSPAACTDGIFGELGDVVIDPRTRTVTHVVVERLGEELEIDEPDWDIGAEGVLVQPYYGSEAPPSHHAVATATYVR